MDFIHDKVPDAEVFVHPYCGEAGAIGACLMAADFMESGQKSRCQGFDVIDGLEYHSITNEQTTCHWCTLNCKRAFIDVNLPGGKGRPWSVIPLPEGFERIITGNSCPKGLVEDENELRIVKKKLDANMEAYPDIAEKVRTHAFR